MEEKTIIVGKPVKRVTLLVLGLILLAGGIACFVFNVWNCRICDDRYSYYQTTFVELVLLDIYEDCQLFVATIIDLGFLMTLFSIVRAILRRKVAVTVTDKRVTYVSALGKRTDLTAESISLVSSGPGYKLCVSTPAGGIKAQGIKNNREVHKEICDLMISK